MRCTDDSPNKVKTMVLRYYNQIAVLDGIFDCLLILYLCLYILFTTKLLGIQIESKVANTDKDCYECDCSKRNECM